MKGNIVLVGFMGSGKTTVGKLLSKEYGFKFIDVDNLIEKREKLSIKEIFTLKGVKRFRKIEKDLIKEQANNENTLISTGGGAWLVKENRDILTRTGICIWLSITKKVALKRIKKETDNRPLISKKRNKNKFLTDLIIERNKVYSLADFKIIADINNPVLVTRDIFLKLSNYNKKNKRFAKESVDINNVC